MTVLRRRLDVAALILLAAFFVAASVSAQFVEERLADPAQEARAYALHKQLRCLVCQNQSIVDSNADLARDLHMLVRPRASSESVVPNNDHICVAVISWLWELLGHVKPCDRCAVLNFSLRRASEGAREGVHCRHRELQTMLPTSLSS